MIIMASNIEPSTYEQACIEARRWIEETTGLYFPCEDFRTSLQNGVLLCKLAVKLTGVNIGELSAIPRSLAWMDNLTIFLNVCRYMGMKKSQLFRVDDLATVRNQDLPLRTKQKEESRRIRNVLITIFWLGKLAYSLENYEGPLPDLSLFENLINKRRPPEMVDQRRNKFELDTLSSGSDTWPRIKRSSLKPSRSSRVHEGSLEYFEQMRQQLIPHLSAKVKEKATMYDKIQRESKQEEIYSKWKDQRPRSRTNPLPADCDYPEIARRAHSTGALVAVNDENANKTNKAKAETYFSAGSITRRTPIKVAVGEKETKKEKGGDTSAVKHRSQRQSFRYNNMAAVVNEHRKITQSGAHASKYKSGKKNEYVSVTALIQQWSSADEKGNKQTETPDSTNRRSLPANFVVNNNLPETNEPQLRRTKSVSACMHDNIPTKTAGLQSERYVSRCTEHTKDTKRKSEQVKIYATADHSQQPLAARGTKLYKKETTENKKWTSKETKSYPSNSSIQYSSEKERSERFGENQSEYHQRNESVMDRKKVEPNPIEFSNETRFKSTGTQRNRDTSKEKRKSEPIGKYATMPTRRRNTHHENRNDDLTYVINPKDTQRYENSDASSNLSNTQLQKKKDSFRRLPTYQEAIKPLHETEVSWATTTAPHHSIPSPEELSSGKTKEPRSRERNQPIQENVVKQRILEAQTLPELDSLFTAKGLPEREATKRSERLMNHDNQDIGLAVSSASKAVGHYSSVASRNELINKSSTSVVKSSNVMTEKSTSVVKSSNVMTEISHSQNRTDSGKEISSHNLSTVYDAQVQKPTRTSKQRRPESDSNRGEKDVVLEEKKESKNDGILSQQSSHINEHKAMNEQERLRQQQKIILDEDFKQRGSSRMTPNVVQQLTKQDGMSFSNVVHDNELLELVAAEEKYWKEKVEKKDPVSEDTKKNKQEKVSTIEKQQRVDEMLREFKLRDQNNLKRVDNSEMTDTLRAEEEFLAQEAEKLLKLRFQEKAAKRSQVDRGSGNEAINEDKKATGSLKSNFPGPLVEKTKETCDNVNVDLPRSPVVGVPSTQKKSPSASSDDIKLQPEADQANYHNKPRRVSRPRAPVYMCSGCRLPVQRDICLFVSELQSYWHEKCFRCSVCHSNLIRGRSAPKIRVIFSKIHCENCLSNKNTGGQSTMV